MNAGSGGKWYDRIPTFIAGPPARRPRHRAMGTPYDADNPSASGRDRRSTTVAANRPATASTRGVPMVDEVLFVCHANMCRSPMAEYIARRLLAAHPVTVASAGTDAVDGTPMHPYAIDLAAGTGADPTGFRAGKLRPEHLAAATAAC